MSILGRVRVTRVAVSGLTLTLSAGLHWHPSFAELPPGAAPAASTAPGTAAEPARPTITRADLAAAYLRLEQAFFARSLPAEETARINRAFDQATQAYFLGNNAEAIRTIDSLASSLATEKQSPAELALVSLKLTVDPPVLRAEGPKQITCHLSSIYDAAALDPIPTSLQLRVFGPQSKVVAERPLTAILGKGRIVNERLALQLAESRLEPGLYHVELALAEGRGLVAGRLQMVEGLALDQQRLAHDERLGQLKAANAQFSQAITTCHARNQLLNDHPSQENSAQFLADVNALASDVASEIGALEAGKNPYSGRPGDYWRVLEVGKRQIPLRVYVPKLPSPAVPAPLLVVLHGMGGDENMFFEAYGAGIVKRIADKKALIVASPRTYSLGSDIKTLHALIDSLGNDYAIDRNRVYLLGHSMGAGAAAALARGHGDTVAAACCIAGGRFQATPASPPHWIVSPELDAVVAPRSLQESARKALSEGLPGELKIMPGYGHTLAVGAILPEAIDWLLRQRRPAAQPR
jgi:predicted esterase